MLKNAAIDKWRPRRFRSAETLLLRAISWQPELAASRWRLLRTMFYSFSTLLDPDRLSPVKSTVVLLLSSYYEHRFPETPRCNV